jgi:hypothetical protein
LILDGASSNGSGQMRNYLDFEKPIAELEARVAELKETAQSGSLDLDSEIGKLEAKSDKLIRETYAKLTPWPTTSSRWPATAPLPTIPRSSAGWRGSAGAG